MSLKKFSISSFVLLLASFAALAAFAASPSRTVKPKVGKTAPSIMCRSISGRMVYLTDYCGTRCPKARRKNTLVHFFATTCKPCEKEIPALKKLGEAFPGDQFVILMVSVGDSNAMVEKYKKTHGINAVFLMDKYGANAKRWNITKVKKKSTSYNLPYTFLVDKQGITQTILPGAHADLDKTIFKKLKLLN